MIIQIQIMILILVFLFQASMGLLRISRSSQLDGSQPSQELGAGSSSPRTGAAHSMPEISSPQPAMFQGPVLMNNNRGIGLYHDIEGGPRIRPQKLFPIRKRAS